MVVFVGVAMQFSDCPPTPPSGFARVVRGTVERPIFAVVRLAPSLTPHDLNEITDETEAEDGALLPVPLQSRPYRSTDSSTMVPQSASCQVMESKYSERDCDVGEMPASIPNPREGNEPLREALPFHLGLEYYPDNFDLNFAPKAFLPSTADDGAEPIITQTFRLDIDVCDDQLWRALRACFAHERFLPCISTYTISRIVINTLSTFMSCFISDLGLIGWTFQLIVLVSLVLCRNLSGESRLYYMNIALVLLGSLVLELCDANLDSEVSLCLNLLMVALFVSPLQTLSTKLG